MTKKSAKRTKHVPQRTCVSCRETLPKRALIRVVRTEAGVVLDPTGKIQGRGAYIHDRRVCWERGLKGALARALKLTAELSEEERGRLSAFMLTLPEEPEVAQDSVSQEETMDR